MMSSAEVARVAAGRRARDVEKGWVWARMLDVGQLVFNDGRHLLLYNTRDMLLYSAALTPWY